MTALEPVLVALGELALVLVLLYLADHWLHQHLQGVMFLLTNDAEVALWLYALVLFPGVFLHEGSHALTAKLLGVRIGRLSILPKRVGGHIRLGVVPIENTDFFRASFIGGAPLLLGSAAIVLIGHFVFGTPEMVAALAAGDFLTAFSELQMAVQMPDAWIWAYLVFAIGNTMFPSRSDMHAWPFVGALLVLFAALAILAGAGSILLDSLSGLLAGAVRWGVLLGASTLLVDLPFFVVLFLMEKALEHLTGRRIVYRA